MKRTILQFVVCSLLLAACLCSQKAYAICDEPTGTGAVFNNFDRIVIYFSYFTHPDQQKVDGYPEILKYENFSKRVESAVRRNFTSCLTERGGKEKSVLVTNTRTNMDKIMLDPKTLTILVEAIYIKYPEYPEDVVDHGEIFFTFYRPGLSPADSLSNLVMHKAYFAVFPELGLDGLDQRINEYFKALRPVKYPMHMDSGEDEFWNNLWKNQK